MELYLMIFSLVWDREWSPSAYKIGDNKEARRIFVL